MKVFSIKIFACIILLAFAITSAIAQVQLSNKISSIGVPSTIRVGLLIRPPFVMENNNNYTGLVIDLWQLVASKENWKYKYVAQYTDLSKSLKALDEKKIDILIGPIPVDFQDLQMVQFSRPFFINRIVLVSKKHSVSFFELIKYIFTKLINYKVFIFLILFILFCHLLWYVEWRNTNSESYKKSIGHAIWFGFLSFFIWEAGDPHPIVTTRGRILLVIWLLTSVFTLAFITASITGALTVSLLSIHKGVNFQNLSHQSIAYVSGDIDSDDIEKLDIYPIEVKNIQVGLAMLQKGSVTGVIVDLPYAKYYLKKHKMINFVMSNDTIDYDEYAFAFPLNSKFKHIFDLAYDNLKSTRHLAPICARYVGKYDAKFCNL